MNNHDLLIQNNFTQKIENFGISVFKQTLKSFVLFTWRALTRFVKNLEDYAEYYLKYFNIVLTHGIQINIYFIYIYDLH